MPSIQKELNSDTYHYLPISEYKLTCLELLSSTVNQLHSALHKGTGEVLHYITWVYLPMAHVIRFKL